MPSVPPIVGLTYSSGPTSPPASAASPAPMANAIALLRPTWMPTAVAASWSIATACIAAPRLVRCRNAHQQHDRDRGDRQHDQVVGADPQAERTSSGADLTGDGTARPVAPQMRMATASRTMPKPIVPISIR